jgi:hypothetical protein
MNRGARPAGTKAVLDSPGAVNEPLAATGGREMKIFRVPQREIKVRITMEGGEELAGVLYVPAAGHGGGPGRLGERLNDEEEKFIPLAEARGPFLVNKNRVMMVELPPGEEELEFQIGEQAVERAVEIGLKGGLRLTGCLKYTMPVEKGRILDYLNAAPLFIPMLRDRRGVLLNSNFLVSLKDLDSSRSGQGQSDSGR